MNLTLDFLYACYIMSFKEAYLIHDVFEGTGLQ